MTQNFAVKDLRDSIQLGRYWMFSAFIKIQLEHSKTAFSVLWEPITVFFVATVLSTVWSHILGVETPTDYFFYVLVGFALWSLLFAKVVNRAVASLGTRSAELSNSIKPVSSIPLEEMAYSLLNFATVFPFVLGLCVWFFGTSLVQLLIFVYGLFLIFVAGISLSLTLGVLIFFVRDFLQIVKAVMRLGFLVTPIIWKPDRLGEYEYLVWYNPFYSYLDLCRTALMNEAMKYEALVISSSITLALFLLAWATMTMFGERVRRGVFRN